MNNNTESLLEKIVTDFEEALLADGKAANNKLTSLAKTPEGNPKGVEKREIELTMNN